MQSDATYNIKRRVKCVYCGVWSDKYLNSSVGTPTSIYCVKCACNAPHKVFVRGDKGQIMSEVRR